MIHELNFWERGIAATAFKHSRGIWASIADAETRLCQHKSLDTYPYDLCVSSDDTYSLPRAAKGESVYLSRMELAIAKWLGPERTRASRKAGKKNHLVDDPNKESFNEINGVAAEIAFGKLFNKYPHETFCIKARSTKEDGGDYTVSSLSIDVKSTYHFAGKLQCGDWKLMENRQAFIDKIDFGCLFVGNYLTSGWYVFHGFCASREWVHPDNYNYLPGGRYKCFWVPQSKLYDVPEIQRHARWLPAPDHAARSTSEPVSSTASSS